MPHRRIAARLAGVDWLRWELALVVVFHLSMGLFILLAPEHLVITPATWATFFYLGRVGMGAAFLAVAGFAATCWYRPLWFTQLLTWLGTYMLGAGWLTGFILAVHRGTGGAYGIIVWSVLLAVWGSTAVRLGLGNGGTSGLGRHLSGDGRGW